MSPPANPLSDGDIAASNVLPAFETSLHFGATERELEAELGWTRDALTQVDAVVSGASTHRHMELMFEKPRYVEFVLAAARAHDAGSLGLVGLACKTLPDVASAMACHARFQRLTNRSATYETHFESDSVHLREHREDPRTGSLLISEYTMLVVVRLLSLLTESPVPVRAMHVRRPSLTTHERVAYERELGARVHTGAQHAALILDPGFLRAPVAKADAELERYFRSVLERSLPAPVAEAPLLSSVRAVVRERLRDGHPTLEDVANALRVGSRTLQRRLREVGTSYQQLLDDTLKSLAEGYLRQPQLSLAEVAWLLGYVEQASFFRAFRRWHDMTPQAFRRRG